MQSNKFLDLVSSPLMNLDHTYRYSGTKLIEKESLSHHITDCIMMGLKIIDTINYRYHTELNSSEYLMKAVYHDLEEVITGDIPRPLKYYNEDTKNAMKGVADTVAEGFFYKQFNDDDAYMYWSTAKDGQEGYILKVVDNLVVVNKVVKEVSLLHNYYMLRVAHEVSQYTRSLLEEASDMKYVWIEYIIELLKGAINTMYDILDEHRDIMESLNIYGQSMI